MTLRLFLPIWADFWAAATTCAAGLVLGVVGTRAAFGKQSGNQGLAYYRVTDLMKVPMTILRAPDDEATLSIMAGAIGTKFSRGAVEFCTPVHWHIRFLIIVTLAAYLVLPSLGGGNGLPGQSLKILILMSSFASLASVLVCLVLLVGALCRCAEWP